MAAIAVCLTPAIQAGVVINEVLYHAPNDLSDLEYVELFNAGDQAVEISGWELADGVEFVFPSDTVIKPGGFVVVCKDAKLFPRFYADVKFVGAYEKSLSNGSDRISLKDGKGEVVDSLEYSDDAPWPTSPDGYSASLERICPLSGDDSVANWAPSTLSDDYDRKPAGSPGRPNSVYQESLPPQIEGLTASVREICPPGTPIEVSATVHDAESVTLRYQVVSPGSAGEEIELPMKATKKEGGFSATIPGQGTGKIVRYRVQARSKAGATRFFPHEHEIRPAHSVYVAPPTESGETPVAHFFNVGEEEFKRGAEYRENASRERSGRGGFGSGGRGGFGRGPESPEDRARREAERTRRDAERLLREDSLERAWSALTLTDPQPARELKTLLSAFRDAREELAGLRDGLFAAEDARAAADALPGQLAKVGDRLRARCADSLNEEQRKLLAGIGVAERDDRERRGPGGRGGPRGGDRGFDRGSMLQRFFNLEQSWFRISMNAEIDAAALSEVRTVVLEAIEERDGTTVEEGERGRPDFRAMMEVVEKQREVFHGELEKNLGRALFAKLDLERGGFGFGSGFGGRGPRERSPGAPLLPQGRSALVYTDADSGETRLFDFINIVPRKSGYKVRLHKDRMIDGMKTINVLFEPDEKTCINEALAYDLYRAAGNATPRAGYLRLLIDGKLVGYHLWFEQANGAFLRHNDISDKGTLYKVTWQGSAGASEFTPEDKRPTERQDIVRRYDNISDPHDGYDDLIKLVVALEEAEGDEEKMWETIEKRFDVENVINYFAVNSLLSHWDGFFNNYYLYHDTRRKKWMIFPFDQDSTWSQRMGDVESLSRMPLNYGSSEAVRGGFGRGGQMWWRDGGEISKPLLANPEFKKQFRARLKELAENVFNEEDFGARLSKAEELLKAEVTLRARARGTDEESAVESLGEIMDGLREHLQARRKFVLAELENGGSESNRSGSSGTR